MNDDFSLISASLDQPIPTMNKATEIFNRIDEVINKAVEEHNGWIAVNAARELVIIARLSGLSLAKMLHGIITSWDRFGIEDDVYSVLKEHLGTVKYTCTRYAEAWQTLMSGKIPDEYANKLVERGIRDVLIVTKTLNAGYEISNEQYKEIVNAPDRMELEEVIRKVKNEPISEKIIHAQMEMNGEIYVYHLGQKHYVGKLDTSSGVYAVQKMIYRICIGGGISRK
jgi:hypothetical protein